MSKALKVGLGLAIVAGIVYAATRAAKAVTESVSFKIKGFEVPTFTGQVATVPLNVIFTNNAPVPVPISRLQVELAYNQNGKYIHAGTLDQSNITIPPGEQVVKFLPKVDLKALFKDVLATAETIIKNKGVDIRADITVTVAGASVTETVYHKIPVTV